MNLKLETEFSKADILKDVGALKKQIDGMRPLPEDVEGKVMQKLRLDWNYNSNAIEGNKLSYGETVAFLMEGITAKGKPLKDHLDIRGHNEAINFLLSIVKEPRTFTESDIRALHKMILVEPYEVKAKTKDGLPTTKTITLGEYKKLPNHVKTATGEPHYYATPEETPAKMQKLLEWYNGAVSADIHPLVIAALFHHKFVAIHPFDDGNGRLSRILMNLILMQNGYPPVIVKMDDRQNYYSLLSRADNEDSWPFVEYIVERLKASLSLFLKAATGESIDEDDDIDKEIALFKMELQNEVKIKPEKSPSQILRIINDVLYPLFRKITIKASEFDSFFFNTEKYFAIDVLRDLTIQQDHIFFTELKLELKSIITSDLIRYHCFFDEFRNSKGGFGISLIWEIKFDKYSYAINDSGKRQIFSKYYDEHITTSDQKFIMKHFIDELKASIKTIL